MESNEPEARVNTPIPKTHGAHGIVILHPLFLRFLLSALIWLAALSLTSIEHFCALGYKTAERLAPFVVASLAALSIIGVRRYRFGVMLAIAIVALYLFAILPAYSYWIHGSGRHHFPGAVIEPPDLPDAQPTTTQ